jgi:hypothetical protein
MISKTATRAKRAKDLFKFFKPQSLIALLV